METKTRIPSSIHDPDGYMVKEKDELLRVLSLDYLPHYEYLTSSGLYDNLVSNKLLLSHTQLKPELVPFISYSSEWSFSQLKDAALCTLEIQGEALNYGMTLKDAPTSNIQFVDGKPILIDITSFEIYEEGKPWQAYRQFCNEFLVPLALASYKSVELLRYNNIPMEVAVKLIPKRHFLSRLGIHLYLHSKVKSKKSLPKNTHISKRGLQALIDNLYNTVKNIPRPKDKTFWKDYYTNTNYSNKDVVAKIQCITDTTRTIKASRIIDIGCNTGLLTASIANSSEYIIAIDNDYRVIDHFYKWHYENILPLVANICNPTPASGWHDQEKESLLDRLHSYKPDLTLALALVHHLCLTNSIPLERIANLFSSISPWLLIEYVPNNDSQVVEMTATIDKHHGYNQYIFIEAFSQYYTIKQTWNLPDSARTLYLMRRKSA